jgi:hypothetical protein
MSTNNHTPSVIEIPLTKGYVAIVDAIDGDLAQHKWHVKTHNNYGCRGIGGRKNHKKLYMHVAVMQRVLGRALVKGEEVDHENGNKQDNRRSNLRLVTHTQNMRNQLRNKANTTGYKGVSLQKNSPNRPYRAYIVVDNKQIHLGYYATPEEAHKAYCEASTKYHGEYGRFE